jgi:hypothetical protein
MTSAERWVETYRFHFDPEMERFWRERLEAEVPDPLARDAALADEPGKPRMRFTKLAPENP